MVVYGATVNGQYALWLRSLDNTVARMLRGTEDAMFPFWSPDGRSIAFFARGKLQKLDIAGGPALAICDAPRVFGGVWTPDGRILVGILSGVIAAVPASGGALSPVTTLDKSRGDVAHVWPQVLSGRNFMYWGASTKPEDTGVIYAASFEKPNERVRLMASETSAVYTSGADGRGYLLWQRGGTLVAQEFDGTKLKFSGEPRPIADAVGVVGSAAFMAVAASGGTILYADADLQRLTWFDRAGQRKGTLGDPGQYNGFRFSPDGKQVATTRIDAGRELVLIDVDRSTSRRATFDSRGGFFPLWSPDGRTILFIGDNVSALYRKDATAAAAPDQRLAPWPDANLSDWSHDGGSVLNTRNTNETRNDIWVVPTTPDGHLATGAQAKPYLRTPVNESAGRFSPEANPRWIAYQSDESGHAEVYVDSFPERLGPLRISASGGAAPQWGPGGRELFYRSPDGKVMAVSLKPGEGSIEAFPPRELFTLPPSSTFEVAPDGQRFLVNMSDPAPHSLNVIVNWPALIKQAALRQ
jgi:Tol biopolymer transport system component